MPGVAIWRVRESVDRRSKMDSMVPPTGDHRASIDGKDFERFVAETLRDLGAGLTDCRLGEQEVVRAADGSYRIDVTVRFKALDAAFLVLIECKDHSRPVEREDVQILADKKRAAGAHKAMLFSTNGFQSGAIDYAAHHGIALIRVLEGALTWETRSVGPPTPPPHWANIPPFVAQFIRASGPGRIMVATLGRGSSSDLVTFLMAP